MRFVSKTLKKHVLTIFYLRIIPIFANWIGVRKHVTFINILSNTFY